MQDIYIYIFNIYMEFSTSTYQTYRGNIIAISPQADQSLRLGDSPEVRKYSPCCRGSILVYSKQHFLIYTFTLYIYIYIHFLIYTSYIVKILCLSMYNAAQRYSEHSHRQGFRCSKFHMTLLCSPLYLHTQKFYRVTDILCAVQRHSTHCHIRSYVTWR